LPLQKPVVSHRFKNFISRQTLLSRIALREKRRFSKRDFNQQGDHQLSVFSQPRLFQAANNRFANET
jgi:hypothetical protein